MANMAAKKLPGFVVLLMVLAILALTVAVLRPVVEELRLVWRLRSPGDSEWKRAADMLIEKGSRRGLVRAIETALVRDTEGFGAWQKKLFELRPHDVHRALPAYEAGLRHEEAAVRRACAGALMHPGWRRPEAVPVLARALESADPVIRWQAGYVLHRMGPGAAAATPALVRAARDPDENVRWAAVYALGAMAPASSDVVPALVEALDDPSALVASHAAGALGPLGPGAASAVRALIEAVRKGDVVVKAEAARALGDLGRSGREAVPVLLGALGEDRDWRYESYTYEFSSLGLGDEIPVRRDGLEIGLLDGRIELIKAALRIGVDVGEVLPCLSKLVSDTSYDVRQEACMALGRIGPAAGGAVPNLVERLRDEDTRQMFPPACTATNYAAADALAAIGTAAVPPLVEALGSSDSRTRYGSAWALAKMGHADGKIVEAFRSTLSDAPLKVTLTVARGLKRFDPGADLVPVLMGAAARTPSLEGVTWESLDGLVGREALPSLPLIREALSKQEYIPTRIAVRLLASMAREAVEPLGDLLAALDGKDISIRVDAIEVLGDLETRAEEVVPALIRSLERDDVRRFAADGLEKFGPKAESALPALWARHAVEEKAEDRRCCLAAISAISPGDTGVIEIHLSEAKGNEQVSAALDLIAKAGPKARSFLTAAEQHLEHEDIAIRFEAARAVWAIDRRIDPVVVIARQALRDDWSSGRWWPPFPFPLYPPGFGPEWRNPLREKAARLLSEMGPAGKAAAPELVACLDFPGHTVRVLAVEALRRTTGDTRLDPLIDAVEGSVPKLRGNPDRMEDFTSEALRVLGEIGPAARAAIPSLERLRAAAPAGPLRAAVDEALRKVAQPRA